MGLPEVFLEHNTSGRRHKKMLRVKPTAKPFVIGSSRDADLRINGEGVQGCHAALRYRNSSWYICDLGGNEDVKINGELATEVKLTGKDAVEIAGHRLQLFTKERESDLFTDVTATAATASVLALHQVVVRLNGRVLETKLLKANEPFTYYDGDSKKTLPAPSSSKWEKTELGRRVIQQRLIGAQEMLKSEKIEFDRDMRKPFAVAILLLFLMIGSLIALTAGTKTAHPEMALDKRSMDIIYDAKVVKKKKFESQKVVKAAAAKAGGTSESAPVQEQKVTQPQESMAPKVTEKASVALTSLRKSGLSSLIGKIAKRANKQGTMVAAVGVAPDVQSSGRALYSVGTSTTGGGGSAAKEGASFKLGGVATHGKAGGAGNFKEGTALAGGSIGSGNIVAMVDDETVIEGGLDRDAIAEVIRRNLGQIRYCYERQLSSNPDLYGKVLVKFTIGASGEVNEPQVGTSTLKSAMVEGCIMRRMASWKFPEPKGGTQVHVSYPFLFKAN